MQDQIIDTRNQQGNNAADIDMGRLEQDIVIFDQIQVHQISYLSRSSGRIIIRRHFPEQ